MRTYCADPLMNVRSQVERYGMRATKHGKRGFALVYGGKPVIRRRQYSTFIAAAKAACAFLDAMQRQA